MQSPVTHLARADVQGIQYLVLSQRSEQAFTDGTMVWMHLVQAEHERKPSLFVRAVHLGGDWLLFDPRHLAGKLDTELPLLAEGAAHGVVFYTLRRLCHTAAGLLELVRGNVLARAVDTRPIHEQARGIQEAAELMITRGLA